MPISHQTKWYSSAMAGTSQVTNAAGQCITNLLDPCLINGFGSVTLDSLVISGGVATLTKSTNHGFLDFQVIEIAGATPASLNGQHRFTRISDTAGSIDATGIADQTATGTITAKTPPLGWTKAFSGTNKAVYQGSLLTGRGFHLRIDDTGTGLPRARGYVAMTDVDTGTDPFPTDVQVSGGGYFPKSSNTTPRDWVLVGNERAFYVSAFYSSYWMLAFFGDMTALAGENDPYACHLGSGGVAGSGYLSYTHYGTNIQLWTARSYSATPNSAHRSCIYAPGLYSGGTSAPNGQWTYPSPIVGAGLPGVGRCPVAEYGGPLRGIMPGYIALLANCRTAFNPGTVLDLSGFPEKTIFLQDASSGAICVELGEWE